MSIFRGGGGYSETEKSQSAKICLNFNFQGGGGYSETEKSQSAKICLNFNFRGGGGYSGVNFGLENLNQNLMFGQKPACASQ